MHVYEKCTGYWAWIRTLNHVIVWIGWNLKAYLVPTPTPWPRKPSTRSDCQISMQSDTQGPGTHTHGKKHQVINVQKYTKTYKIITLKIKNHF